MIFNHDSRKKNVIRSSFTGAVCRVISIVLGFLYRMIFLRILTVEYLGINGLFTNILGILGLAELGIADAIIFRLYKPISLEYVERVGQLMRFYRKTYHLIALTILLLGCAVCPFLKYLIRDTNEIPGDINVYIVFVLLLVQSASTYLFSYRLSLLNADQKQYRTTVINTIGTFVRYSCQLFVLVISRSYTFSLASGIIVTIIINWMAGEWVRRQYIEVFKIATDLSKRERRDIYKDTSATLLHKIGGTVVSSTDNILLSRYIGLKVTGIYSNYSLIISGLSGLMGSVLETLTPSLGNAHATLNDSERYKVYKKSLFLNLWLSGMAGSCLFILLNDFILLWLNKELFLDQLTVFLLCILFYLESARSVSVSYTMSCGLFTRDRIRPIIESIINILISILCLKKIGTAGIFVGTIFSYLATVFLAGTIFAV